MDREIPYYLGKEDEERAWAYRDSGFTAVMGMGSLFLLALVTITLVNWGRYDDLTRFALPMAGIAVLLQNLLFLHYNVFRARQRIGPISSGWAIQGFVNLLLSVPLVILFRVHGLFIALVGANVITFLILQRWTDWRFRIRARRDEMKRLIVRGGPILAYLFMEVLLAQVDKLVIVALLSREELGFYGIAATIGGLLRYMTASASFTLFPKFLADFGKTGKVSSLAHTLKEPTFAFSIFIPVFLGLVYLWIHIPVAHLLPKFLPGVDAMRILVCGTVFFSLASLPSYFLITVNRTKVILIGGAAIVLLEAGLNSLFIKMGFGIKGAAMGAAICQFLYGTVLLSYAMHLVPEGERSVFRMVIRTYAPAIYVGAVIAGTLLILPFGAFEEMTLAGDIRMGLLRGAILLTVTSPLWILLQKRTGVFTLAWSLLTHRGSEE